MVTGRGVWVVEKPGRQGDGGGEDQEGRPARAWEGAIVPGRST